MLIVLVFLVFFFVDVLQKLRIHTIQYLVVGFALCIFYTLLIAISEHLGFAKAYIISATAVPSCSANLSVTTPCITTVSTTAISV